MTPRQPKPPAFQFYPADFLVGSIGLSLEEVGAYIRLLCFQWEHGSVPTDVDALARILSCDVEKARLLWRAISGKFSGTTRAGFRINLRLERERVKQAKFRKSQRQKGLKGGRPKTRGFSPANPGLTPGKALRLLSSDLVRTPHTPPDGGAVENREKDPTREERRWAKAVLREQRRCPHTPACESVYACEGRLIGERRDEERRGLKQGAS